MKIKGKDSGIIRIAKRLLDKSQNAQGIVTTTIYSFFDKSRHPHFPTYRHEENIHEMVKMELLTIIKTEYHNKIVGLEIQRLPYFTVQFSPQRIQSWLLKKRSRPTPSQTDKRKDKALTWKRLKINVRQGTFQYGDNQPVEISIGKREVRLFIYLMENRRVVSYLELAKELDLNCYHEGCTNKQVARDLQFIKRDLLKFLTKIGVPKKELNSMFITKRTVGYKLRDS